MISGRFGPRRGSLVDTTRVDHLTPPRRFGAQNAVEAELDKRGGKNFGPPNGNKMTFFIDDMSMPEVRSRRPVAFLRSYAIDATRLYHTRP